MQHGSRQQGSAVYRQGDQGKIQTVVLHALDALLGIARDHHDVDAWMADPYLAQHGRQKIETHGQTRTYTHLPIHLARMRTQRMGQAFQRHAHGRQLLQQGLPGSRRHSTPPHAFYEARAEMAFQLTHLQADRRLGQLQQLRSLRKAALLNDQTKTPQQHQTRGISQSFTNTLHKHQKIPYW